MDTFINHAAAMKFKDEIQDPIVRNLVMRAYGTLIFEVAPVEVQGQFDLLFFFKVLEAFLRDREGRAQELLGEDRDGLADIHASPPSGKAPEVVPSAPGE